ncbi:MAG: ABC transporter ATP-binding protein [Pseudomonadota bacterium]|nr:ABC transporter ATP-binding protein [Pseudomonadota bacterium]
MAIQNPVIELESISKSFGPVKANKNISLKIEPGTIHGIVGENGAGKSTLMSILYGFYKADSGTIKIQGKRVSIVDSQTAIEHGIGMVFQHFKLVETFTVLENIILGAEGGNLIGQSITNARQTLSKLAEDYELNVDPDSLIEGISVGMQQRVEILKALYRKAEILILDEPTGVLTPAEAEHLFRILRNLKAEGKTIVLITHKLKEIMNVTDTVSVMRQGEMTSTIATNDTSPEKLAELMVGRKVLLRVQKKPPKVGRTVLACEKLSYVDKKGIYRLKDISFEIKAGEILGIAGVAGNGQSELLEVLAGIKHADGKLTLNSAEIDLHSTQSTPLTRRHLGISHVPEDRQRLGLIMEFYAWENIALGYHDSDTYNINGIFMNNRAIKSQAEHRINNFDIRPRNPNLMAKSFSGGNQQKIVLAREIEQNPDLLIVGQPTRGVDIGAIEFIHSRLINMRDSGKAVLLISVELDEILSLSDRILVMFDGKIMGEKEASKTNEKELGLLMAGVN